MLVAPAIANAVAAAAGIRPLEFPMTAERVLAMIRERNWIDLPFVYETGQRAILTFEKGVPGDRAFDQALAAWTTPG